MLHNGRSPWPWNHRLRLLRIPKPLIPLVGSHCFTLHHVAKQKERVSSIVARAHFNCRDFFVCVSPIIFNKALCAIIDVVAKIVASSSQKSVKCFVFLRLTRFWTLYCAPNLGTVIIGESKALALLKALDVKMWFLSVRLTGIVLITYYCVCLCFCACE